jgi:hypothetical protein
MGGFRTPAHASTLDFGSAGIRKPSPCQSQDWRAGTSPKRTYFHERSLDTWPSIPGASQNGITPRIHIASSLVCSPVPESGGARRDVHLDSLNGRSIRTYAREAIRQRGTTPQACRSRRRARDRVRAGQPPHVDREMSRQTHVRRSLSIGQPKKLYAIHGGAIYEGQTTDRGKSYHGYPYRGKLARSVIDALRDMAVKKSCEKEFDAWVKRHIEVHGT